jgi:hypothetical protein
MRKLHKARINLLQQPFALQAYVRVALRSGEQRRAQIIGRTIEANPVYDLRLDDGTIVQNVRLYLGDNENYLINAMVP